MTWPRPDSLILVYPSIHYVLKAEQVLKQQAIPCELIPMPREIRSDCGMALLCRDPEPIKLCQLLDQTGNCPEAYYRQQGKNFILISIGEAR
jgi:hypothetical protein